MPSAHYGVVNESPLLIIDSHISVQSVYKAAVPSESVEINAEVYKVFRDKLGHVQHAAELVHEIGKGPSNLQVALKEQSGQANI